MANGNPYYVHPGMDLGPGLQGLAGTIMAASEQRRKIEAEEAEKKRMAQMRAGALQAFQTGDPNKIAEYALANPEMSDALNTAWKTKSGFRESEADRERQEYLDAAMNFYQNPTQETLQKYVDEKSDIGFTGLDKASERYASDPEGFRKMVGMDIAGLDPKRFKAMQEAEGVAMPGSAPAEVQVFDYLTAGLPEEQKQQARLVKLGLSPRASESAQAKASKAFAAESGKLQARLGLEPDVAGAVTAAKNEANSIAKEQADNKSKATAWNVYDSAMSNLAKAMGGTKTGPFIGFIPAVTADAQIAEGSVAVMAPVLKQMFRAAGEGVFTDKDQEILLDMIPKRRDLPETRIAKIKAIDAIVRAKLGMTEEFDRTISELSDEEILQQLQGAQ